MKKIVLAYSGGLDTSIILKWLQENYKAEVIAYTSDIGQEMNTKKIIKNAKKLGVKKIIIENLKNIFVTEFKNDIQHFVGFVKAKHGLFKLFRLGCTNSSILLNALFSRLFQDCL